MFSLDKRIVCAFMAFLTMLLLLGMSSCSCGRHRSPNSRGTKTENPKAGNDNRHHRRGSRSGGNRETRNNGKSGSNIIIYQPTYFSQNITVNQNVSLQESLYLMDPVARENEEHFGVGGTKLIAEMSADAKGIYCSRNFNTNININVLTLDQLKLQLDYSKLSVYNQIINQKIVVNSSNVGFLGGGNSIAELVEGFVNTLLTGRLVVHLTITNVTNERVSFEIKQGQMLEIVNENVQNLVVAQKYEFSIAAKQQTTFDVRVYCAAQHRGDPSNSSVRFTPYLLKAPSEVYESQSSVWEYIENGN